MDIEQESYKNCNIVAHFGLNCENYAGPCYIVNSCTITYPDGSTDNIPVYNGISGVREVHSHIDKNIDKHLNKNINE